MLHRVICSNAFHIRTLQLLGIFAFPRRPAQGFFRFRHARLKEFAECVAFYNGQAQEKEASETAFSALYWRMRSLFKRSFYMILFGYFQGQCTTVVSLLVVVLFILSTGSLNGQPVTAGTSQTAISSINQLISSLSTIPAYYSMAAQLAGITHRCSQLVEALEELQVHCCSMIENVYCQ